MKVIIEIDTFSKAIPKYRTWYKYHDILWVSVIYSASFRKSHLRRKSRPNFNLNKIDNEMCPWHSNWQFQKIESKFGLEKTGIRTYEIVEKYEEEIHRIDSVVDNIAIEFQHTLSVSLNEMDSRYFAHKALNYLPYLVLDLTEFSAKESLFKIRDFSYTKIDFYIYNNTRNEYLTSFLKKIKKWFNSKYFLNDNLFIDFSDLMIRFTPKLKKEYLGLSHEEFILQLLQLEEIVLEEKAKEKAQVDLKKQQQEIADQQKIEQNKQQYLVKVNENKIAIDESSAFEYYRKCLRNKIIKECIENLHYIELIKYDSFSKKEDNIYKKYHIYSIFRSAFTTPEIEIQYITKSRIEGKNFTYLFSEINMIKEFENGLKVFTFISKPGERITLVSKRLEFVRGILHSINNHALFTYDKNGILLSKEYYILNVKVSQQEFEELSTYYEIGFFSNEDSREKYAELIRRIEELDINDLIQYYCQRYTPSHVLMDYYDSIDERQPLMAKNEW